MPDEATLRRLALALPGATEQPHHGFPSFRAGGRIFATLPAPTHANLMLDEEAIGEAVASFPGACGEQWWGARLAAVRVQLADLPEDALAAMLAEAHARATRH